jgi:3-hydroxyacyl-[acyl-carrier-protein] dehydratase
VKFVDDVRVDAAGAVADGSLFVDPNADYLKDHFPGAPMLPGLLMLEAAVRTAGALWGETSVLSRVERLQVVRRVVPGETLSVRARLIDAPADGRASFTAEGRVGGELAMRARFQLRGL